MAKTSEFESVALVHIDTIYKIAISLCRDKEQAGDLVQITYLKAFEQFETFKKGTNCKAWLARILRNSWIDQIRHKQVAGEILSIEENLISESVEDKQTVWSNSEDLIENFSDEQIIKALKKLPEEQRMALFLIDVEQFSQEEVSEIMGVAVGTIKSRTSRARMRLKRELLSYAKEMGFVGGEK